MADSTKKKAGSQTASSLLVPDGNYLGTTTRDRVLSYLLAIDPGADMGWALFESATLISCGLGQPDGTALRIARVAIERPMIYPGPRQKARPRDVITLALRAGEAAGLYARVYGVTPEYFEPDEWKGGSISKEAHHPRIWKRLNGTERRLVSTNCGRLPEKKQHNVLDAIGIGLFALGRNR